jgi:hypothetical protein
VRTLQIFLVSFESLDRHSLFAAVISRSNWSALNTPKSSVVPAVKTTVHWGQRIAHSSRLGLRFLPTVHWKSGSENQKLRTMVNCSARLLGNITGRKSLLHKIPTIYGVFQTGYRIWGCIVLSKTS